MAKTGLEAANERMNRIKEAIALRKPDRVPILLMNHLFATKYAGLVTRDAFFDAAKFAEATKKMVLDLEPELYQNSWSFTCGRAFEAVDLKQIKWPGHGVPADHSFQFVEGEYVKPEEYDAFLADPSDFILRVYLPRLMGTMAPISQLPPLMAFLNGYVGLGVTMPFAGPGVVEAFESLVKAGRAFLEWNQAAVANTQELLELGFFDWGNSAALVPFDLISDMMRGMRGTMLDMYRQPEKLLEAEERIYPMIIDGAIARAKMVHSETVFMPLHRGADGFMSDKQFAKFYWPGLKRLIVDTIDAGLIPLVFFEGGYNTRLEYLQELPKGKIIGLFDTTDMVKAKKIIGDTVCLCGNLPVSLLQTGTSEQVRDATKKLIDDVGADGGYIMSTRGVMDECDPQLVKVWVDCTREYGVY